MTKKRATFRLAIALAILFTGVFSLRVLAATADEMVLQAHAQPVRGKNLVMVDLTLINKGSRSFSSVTPTIRDFSTRVPEQWPIITRDVSFDVMLNGKPRIPGYTIHSAYDSGMCRVIDLRPGEEWRAVCILNWEFSLDEAGEYSAHAILSLHTFNNPPEIEELTVQSNYFSFVIKPLDREGLKKINLADLHALEGMATCDIDATLAALSVEFSEEPSAVQRLADILGKKTFYLSWLSREALEISLSRLKDQDAAISCAEGMLRGSSAEMRLIGVRVIYNRGSKAEVPALMTILDKADVAAIRRVLDKDEVPPLETIHDDEEYNVLWETCLAVEKLRGFQFVIPEHCDNVLEVMIAQAKKWWAEKGRLGP